MTSVWPLAGTTFCAARTAPQTEQCLPSVRPVSVQVGALAASMTSVWPLAGTTFCAARTSPQTEQCLPSVRPVSVQVGAFAASMTSVCGRLGTTCCASMVSPQGSHCLPSVRPVAEQVAGTAGRTFTAWMASVLPAPSVCRAVPSSARVLSTASVTAVSTGFSVLAWKCRVSRTVSAGSTPPAYTRRTVPSVPSLTMAIPLSLLRALLPVYCSTAWS